MKKIFGMALLLCMIAVNAFAATRVAVVDFQDMTGKNLQAHIVGAIVDRFIAHPDFDVYERNRLKYVLDEAGFQYTGMVSQEQAVELGKMAGVQYVITGEVTQATTDQVNSWIPYVGTIYEDISRVTMHVSMINVQTGQIENKESTFSGKVGSRSLLGAGSYRESQVFEAADMAVNDFMLALNEKYPIIGKVIDSTGSEAVYVNLGTKVGVKDKMKLDVFSEGAPIIVDGKVLGVRRKKIATIKVTDAQENMSTCESDDWEKITKGAKVTLTKRKRK